MEKYESSLLHWIHVAKSDLNSLDILLHHRLIIYTTTYMILLCPRPADRLFGLSPLALVPFAVLDQPRVLLAPGTSLETTFGLHKGLARCSQNSQG